MKTHPFRAVTAGLGLALSATLLVGCGGDDQKDDPKPAPTTSAVDTPTEDPTPTETATSEATETVTPEATEATEPAGDVTAPGTELAIGDVATVAGDNFGKDYMAELKVTKITAAKPGELDAFKGNNFKPAEWDGYYITVTGTVISGDAKGADPAIDVSGTSGGEQVQDLIKMSTFAPCENENFATGQPGESVTSCTIALAPKGSKVDGAAFAASVLDEPIFWK